MRRYETIFISSPNLSEEEYKEKNLRMQEIIKSLKGKVIKVEEWEKKKLAYDIKKESRGFYTLLDYGGTQAVVEELEKTLRLDDKVLKYLTTKTSDKLDLKAIQLDETSETEPSEVEPTEENQEKGEGA